MKLSETETQTSQQLSDFGYQWWYQPYQIIIKIRLELKNITHASKSLFQTSRCQLESYCIQVFTYKQLIKFSILWLFRPSLEVGLGITKLTQGAPLKQHWITQYKIPIDQTNASSLVTPQRKSWWEHNVEFDPITTFFIQIPGTKN